MQDSTRLSLLTRLRESQTGDSWEEFAQVYDGLILHWLSRNGVQASDAEDIRQEVMTTVFREIKGFEHNGRTGAFRNWLRTITSNRMRQLWQNRGSNQCSSGPSLEEIADELSDSRSRLTLNWEKEHDRYVLDYLLGEIEDRFSETSLSTFRRIVIEGEPAADVAKSLGMTLGAARVAQHRVLKALKTIGQGMID